MRQSRLLATLSRAQLVAAHDPSRQRMNQRPSPAAVIEARKAHKMAAAQPLNYALGEPLPGRSALDKMKRQGREL